MGADGYYVALGESCANIPIIGGILLAPAVPLALHVLQHLLCHFSASWYGRIYLFIFSFLVHG